MKNSKTIVKTLRILCVCVIAGVMFASCGGLLNTKTYTVDFNSNGGTYVASAQVKSGATVSEPTPPTKSGYVFDGWYKNGSTTKFSFSTKITANTTLVAHWKERVTLNILGYGVAESGEGQVFGRICNEFMEANPDVTISYELYYDDEYQRRVASRISNNNIPDIAYMGADERWGGAWKNSNQQIDNTPYFPSYIDANLVPNFYGTGVKPYLPLGGSNFCTVVGVNMQLLETIGCDEDDLTAALANYNDFKTLAQAFNTYKADHPNSGLIACLSTHGADTWVWGSCVLSALIPRTTGDPKWIEKAARGDKRFNSDEFKAALQVIDDWVDDGILDPNSVSTDDGTGKANFAAGKYLMYIDGQWGFGEANFEDLAEDIKLFTIPAITNGVASMNNCMAAAWQVGYGITRKGTTNAAVLDAAKRWMAYFNSEEETIQRLRDGGISCPIIRNFTLPNDMDPLVAEKAKLSAYPDCYVIDAYLSGATNDALINGVKDIVTGTKTPAQVAAAIQTAYNNQSIN